MNLKLNNKNALVCGSTQGIGKATAMLLAAEGVNVTLCAEMKINLSKFLLNYLHIEIIIILLLIFQIHRTCKKKYLTILKKIMVFIF